MKRAAIVLASALTVGSINVIPAIAEPAPVAPSAVQANGTSKADASASHATDTRVQHLIQKTTDEALTPHAMDKLASLFTAAQQQRIEKSNSYSEGYGHELDARIDSVCKTWKQKYGHEFSMVKNPDALDPMFAAIRTQAPAHPGGMVSGEVSIKDKKGTTEVAVPLIRDAKDNWKIAVPNSLTASRLRDNLLAELTAMNNQSAHWPAAETDAYRMVTRHVMRAIMDQPMPEHMQASAKTIAPAAAQQAPAQKPVAASSSSGHWWKFWTW